MATSDSVRRRRTQADESDHFAKRGYYSNKVWRAGVRKATKVKANRRMRRELKQLDA